MPSFSPGFIINGQPCAIATEDLGDQAITESFDTDGPKATVMIKCFWANRLDVVKGLLGSVIASGTTLSRTPPFQYPDLPNMICTSIGQTRGIKWRTRQGDGWGTFVECVLPANFSVPTWNIDSSDLSGIPYTTTLLRTSTEIFSPPGGGYFFNPTGTGGPPVPESTVAYIRAHCEIAVTRHQVAYPAVQQVMSLESSVNSSSMIFGDRTFPRGCVLYISAEFTPTADPSTGIRTWDITHSLLGNDNIEWNAFLAPNNGGYQLINTRADGSGITPFPYNNLLTIFGDTF